MGKYIELDVAKKAFQNMDTGHVGGSTLLSPEEFSEYLDEIPTADVAPVDRGHWLDVGCYDIGFWQCSCCGFLSEAIAAPKLYKFCPNCGKEMEINNYEERN